MEVCDSACPCLVDFLSCGTADSSAVIVFITKLFVMDKQTLPQHQTRFGGAGRVAYIRAVGGGDGGRVGGFLHRAVYMLGRLQVEKSASK